MFGHRKASTSSNGQHQRNGSGSGNGHSFEPSSSSSLMVNRSQLKRNGLQPNKRPRTDFLEKLNIYRSWLAEFDDDEKNVFIRELLSHSGTSQIHLLSSLLEPRLHQDCPPNCQDPFASVPAPIALLILGYLDPASLCKCARVCRLWRRYANEPYLWKKLCRTPRSYRLSCAAAEKKHLEQFTDCDGVVLWKEAFSERYRLWRNWYAGRCVVRTFEGHTQGISCVQFDADRIVSGSSDNTIRLWDIRTNCGLGTMTLTGHSATVRCLRLDGNRLASGSNDFTIKVWDLSVNPTWSSIACRQTMIGHTNFVRCLQMDCEKIVSGSYDRVLKVWNIENGQCYGTLTGHNEAVLCLQYDGDKVVSGSADNAIKAWDLRSGQCVMTLHNAHQNAVTCLQFDSDRIVSGSLDR
uniref:F-box domain-containing protein n=1 Tax=Plectus sambesii TaxID=2011161 RepID=A0A914XB47_9BILA